MTDNDNNPTTGDNSGDCDGEGRALANCHNCRLNGPKDTKWGRIAEACHHAYDENVTAWIDDNVVEGDMPTKDADGCPGCEFKPTPQATFKKWDDTLGDSMDGFDVQGAADAARNDEPVQADGLDLEPMRERCALASMEPWRTVDR